MKAISPDDQPHIVPLKDPGFFWGKPKYRVAAGWEWEWKDGILVLSRKKYEFDAASVPRILWAAFGYTPDGLHRAASLAHDIGCERRGQLIRGEVIGRPEYRAVLLGDASVRITPEISAGFLSSKEVHSMWYDFMHATEGTRATKNKTMWAGVRAFGPRF